MFTVSSKVCVKRISNCIKAPLTGIDVILFAQVDGQIERIEQKRGIEFLTGNLISFIFKERPVPVKSKMYSRKVYFSENFGLNAFAGIC